MKLPYIKAGAAAALAGALLFAAPLVAQADTQNYVPSTPGTRTFTITGNGPVPVGGFQPGADVQFTLIGKGISGANIATANLPVTAASVTKTADATGSATAVVTLPASPSGTYTLAVSGPLADGSGAGGGGTTGGGTAGSGASEGGSSALPVTGMDANSLLGIWVGGGALVLAGGVVVVAAKTRRRGESA